MTRNKQKKATTEDFEKAEKGDFSYFAYTHFEKDLTLIKETFLDKRSLFAKSATLHQLLEGFLLFVTQDFDPKKHVLTVSTFGTVLIDREAYIDECRERDDELIYSESCSAKRRDYMAGFAAIMENQAFIFEDPFDYTRNTANFYSPTYSHIEDYQNFFLELLQSVRPVMA